MDRNHTPGRKENEALSGTCPYCLSEIDVNFDIKGRPYWRCGRCDIRTFGTRSALGSLRAAGWIWLDERPMESLRDWLAHVAEEAGLEQLHGVKE